MEVNATCLNIVIKEILELINNKEPSYICVANVHMCMEANDSIDFRKIVNSAKLVVADGRPIYWAQKLLGYSEAKQIRGQELMTGLCSVSVNKKLNIGLYGGSTPEVLTKVISVLNNRFPNILINYYFSPPFVELTELENKTVINDIIKSQIDILFVGIGCPKQERWMAKNSPNIPCVMIGVGAAFDFIAGEKRYAPQWIQKIGCEWLFRLLNEPRRLTPRYLKSNPRFIYHFIKQFMKI